MTYRIIDQRNMQRNSRDLWPSVVVASKEIHAALGRMTEGTAGTDGRREVLIVHPDSTEPGLGLAPGIDVSFGVLMPGESTRPRRHNTADVSMCIAGAGRADVGSATFDIAYRDAWITPSMNPTMLTNTGTEPWRYVTFSSRPMLEKLEVYFEELDPPTTADEARALEEAAQFSAAVARAKDLVPGFTIGDDQSWLLPYEHLVDPEPIRSLPLQWRWLDVEPYLDNVRALRRGYNGRPLYCLYNPATGNRNGTTFCFFATITSAAPNGVGPVHRHNSAAINYILEGSGWSIVDGRRVEWSAGDIMLSAPGWAPHGHATGPDGAVILTIQDHPFHIGAETLIWQEDLDQGPILSLGTQRGFQTNLASVLAGDN